MDPFPGPGEPLAADRSVIERERVVSSSCLWRCIIRRVHAVRRQFLQFLSPVLFRPCLAALCVDQTRNIKNVKVAISPVARHGEHEAALIKSVGNQTVGTAV
ncbi:hypothetical protein KCU81_g255, partial [Aureobasidium melanogenum]